MADNKITPRWLKLKEAARYSGIGKERLKKLADECHIKGFQDPDDRRGTWIFDRNSLDQYRENQAGRIRQKALEHLRKLYPGKYRNINDY